jgi:hypothetical protein
MTLYLTIAVFVLGLTTIAVAETCTSYCYVDSFGNTICSTVCNDEKPQ